MADDTTTLYYTGAMKSLKELEDTCNTEELNLEEKLQSLDIVLDDGKKATEAVYKKTDNEGLGELKIEKYTDARANDAQFKGKAYILTQPVGVLVFR